MDSNGVVVVTGASSGFGELTASKLAADGYTVIGTSRNPEGQGEGYEMLSLDVTSDDSIAAFVAGVVEKHGRVDVLVNNAGRSHSSLIEETTIEDAKAIFEVNFWGMVRMNQAILPIMRSQGSGLIVQVSSLAGLVGTPGQGFYGASKHALEGYTETLRAEIGSFPVEVAMVEPGFFRTSLGESMIRNGVSIADYDSFRDTVGSKLDEEYARGGDPEEVVAAIGEVIRENGKKLRRLVGADARTITRLKRWLPEKTFIDGMRKQFGLK